LVGWLFTYLHNTLGPKSKAGSGRVKLEIRTGSFTYSLVQRYNWFQN